jgi:hypothetical protein
MANYLSVTEYAVPEQTLAGFPQVSWEAPVVDQAVLSISGAQATSLAFNAKTNLVRLNANAACNIAFGTSPTIAADGGQRLSPNQTEFKRVAPGTGLKVAVIAASA